MTDCAACQRPTDATLCHACTGKLGAVLDDLPQWLAELEITVTQQAKTSGPDTSKATKKAEQPLPYHPAAAELLTFARRGVGSWISHVAGPRGLTPPPPRVEAVIRHDTRVRISRNRAMRVELDVVEIRPAVSTTLSDRVAWLAIHTGDVRQVDEAGEILTAAQDLRNACRRMVDNLGRRWAGPCTATVVERALDVTADGDQINVTVGEQLTEPSECGADLRTRPGDKTIVCRDCGAVYDPITRAQWIIAQGVEHQAGPRFIANALTDAGWPVKENTITQWAKRGKLFSYRDDPAGRSIYRVGDVLDLVKTARSEAGVIEHATPGMIA